MARIICWGHNSSFHGTTPRHVYNTTVCLDSSLLSTIHRCNFYLNITLDLVDNREVSYQRIILDMLNEEQMTVPSS
jgi:hypothetical protein